MTGDPRAAAVGEQPLHRLRDRPGHDGAARALRGGAREGEDAGTAAHAQLCLRRQGQEAHTHTHQTFKVNSVWMS